MFQDLAPTYDPSSPGPATPRSKLKDGTHFPLFTRMLRPDISDKAKALTIITNIETLPRIPVPDEEPRDRVLDAAMEKYTYESLSRSEVL